MNKNHPFHLVTYSPWPILGSMTALNNFMGLIKWFHLYKSNLMMMSMMTTLIIMYQWWRDVIRESTYQGNHTLKVSLGLRWGMILFIISEIFFFLSFFWSFFHSSLTPSIEIGMKWPPMGIITFNPIEIPFLNTLILLSSGLTVTWAHHSLMENNFKQTIWSLTMTVSLGLYFSILQLFEYKEASFCISDSIYGSTFFMATGFHGLHVIIGTLFLMTCLMRLMLNHFSKMHHFGFEAAAWYWHFVDVVWIFLYMSMYWWGK
uniref:Cytochrome c oxidase subunit 3 n=1 Tax=Agonita chinensis TaxID=2003340 RepID=A0A343SEM9_9CUCU|nr:cytochrome c oxidase subunit III [Agonita chinensis]